ncbi:Histidine biosynthesis bifunctional protein hisB [Lunasporangiospora selenospora]|uniref:Imidazole glycerol phosphate synthase hisHF n=1 Tax=Lunasporangiospora selenospora TaxID=979761 RepID=A0A9P6FQE9_9FUNG|nr:Histidine biosynthesis bifunctional protein hisB [Lunasporangiospora selenospora]
MTGTYLLDYGAGNVRSVVNAVQKLGHDIIYVKEPSDILKADKLIFPGVGAFGSAMASLHAKGYAEPLKAYLAQNRPFMGICIGMQSLFEGSDESPNVPGLGVIPGRVRLFDSTTKSVPHMGWNTARTIQGPQRARDCGLEQDRVYYFVHSFAVPYTASSTEAQEWALTTTQYGDQTFISSVRQGNIFCTQFHPEKSGFAGLNVLKAFLDGGAASAAEADAALLKAGPAAMVPGALSVLAPTFVPEPSQDQFTKRIVACLDVRANDQGDLVVTKGDQYDVREQAEGGGSGDVRNLGKPVELARRYFEEGADEVTFLNITSFRNCPLQDTPMLEVLKRTSETVFVPLTIGGGIKDVVDPDGKLHSALEVAGEYFRSGADKVSIGSDAVYAAEKYYALGGKGDGTSAIETIAHAYGSQAVVISVDPKKVYVRSPEDAPTHHVIEPQQPGPNGEKYCWYQCTVSGGREGRDLDVHQLVVACEALGAGEILLNSMDQDGMKQGYDLALVQDVRNAVRIPVIASSGAGREQHFVDVFEKTGVEAALAAGIFHRREVPLESVKSTLKQQGVRIRNVDASLAV